MRYIYIFYLYELEYKSYKFILMWNIIVAFYFITNIYIYIHEWMYFFNGFCILRVIRRHQFLTRLTKITIYIYIYIYIGIYIYRVI